MVQTCTARCHPKFGTCASGTDPGIFSLLPTSLFHDSAAVTPALLKASLTTSNYQSGVTGHISCLRSKLQRPDIDGVTRLNPRLLVSYIFENRGTKQQQAACQVLRSSKAGSGKHNAILCNAPVRIAQRIARMTAHCIAATPIFAIC